MKRILTAAMFIIATAFTASASDDINTKAIENFNQAFKNATNITWTQAENMSQVSFDWNNQHLKVFYNEEGELSAILKSVQIAQMPALVQMKVNDYAKDYQVTEAMELNSSNDGLSYYVSLKNDKKEMIVKLLSNGDASVIKKIKK